MFYFAITLFSTFQQLVGNPPGLGKMPDWSTGTSKCHWLNPHGILLLRGESARTSQSKCSLCLNVQSLKHRTSATPGNDESKELGKEQTILSC